MVIVSDWAVNTTLGYGGHDLCQGSQRSMTGGVIDALMRETIMTGPLMATHVLIATLQRALSKAVSAPHADTICDRYAQLSVPYLTNLLRYLSAPWFLF